MPRIYTRQSIEFIVSESGCHICTSHRKDRDGYPIISVNQKDCRLSRHTWAQNYGPIPTGSVIRHTCDERACINPSHLILGTQADNMRDKVLRGRTIIGERHPNAKLTIAAVLFIRNSSESHAALGRKYGVADATIRKIRKGINWKSSAAKD